MMHELGTVQIRTHWVLWHSSPPKGTTVANMARWSRGVRQPRYPVVEVLEGCLAREAQR